MSMTATERPTGIPPYALTPEAQHPPADAGGSIAEVEAAREGHPTDPRRVMEKCTVPGCGKMITKKNMEQHRRNIHKLYKRGPHGKKPDKPADEPSEKKPTRARKLTANEIVVVVVGMRWPNGVPVDKIEALLEWQRHTERFLTE